jgi:hypothetical protein
MMAALCLQMTLQSHTCSIHTDSRSRNRNWTRWKVPNPDIWEKKYDHEIPTPPKLKGEKNETNLIQN